jgi:hypothetical protein
MIWGRVVRQPLSLSGLYRCHGALSVIHPARVPHEIKLPQIAVQVLFANVVTDADDAALYKREGLSAVFVFTSPRAYSLRP